MEFRRRNISQEEASEPDSHIYKKASLCRKGEVKTIIVFEADGAKGGTYRHTYLTTCTQPLYTFWVRGLVKR